MNMHEYNSRVGERNRIDSEYQNPKWDAITNAYIAMDLDKYQFCKVVDAIGVEQITDRVDHWNFVRNAIEEKQFRIEQERKKARLKFVETQLILLQNEAEELKSSIVN